MLRLRPDGARMVHVLPHQAATRWNPDGSRAPAVTSGSAEPTACIHEEAAVQHQTSRAQSTYVRIWLTFGVTRRGSARNRRRPRRRSCRSFVMGVTHRFTARGIGRHVQGLKRTYQDEDVPSRGNRTNMSVDRREPNRRIGTDRRYHRVSTGASHSPHPEGDQP